jgi:hypothetical protein
MPKAIHTPRLKDWNVLRRVERLLPVPVPMTWWLLVMLTETKLKFWLDCRRAFSDVFRAALMGGLYVPIAKHRILYMRSYEIALPTEQSEPRPAG